MKKLLFTAFAAIAILGCSNDLDELPCISCGTTRGTSVTYSGETYETVKIGNQTWMARNLNYDASGSKCYDNSTANCAKYGRLYDWATAMNLPDSCNPNSCASQVGAKHQGICPNGWHIPSHTEWTALTDYVGGSNNAGFYLKATSGWNEGRNGLGLYGFSALPGGFGNSDGSFNTVGNSGYWWSASVYNYTYGRSMDNREYLGYISYYNKGILYSVRCLQD